MPGPGPHMMYAMGSGLGLAKLSNGQFTPHHTLTYTINAFFGPDLGSFSEWIGSILGSNFHQMGSTLANYIHDPFLYVLILGLPLSVFYSWISKILLQRKLLDSVSGVLLSRKQCLLLVFAGSLSHFFLDHLFEENGHSTMYTWILSTGWWENRAPVNPDAVVVVGFICICLIGGFIYINRVKSVKSSRKQLYQTVQLFLVIGVLYCLWCATQIYWVNPRRPAVGEEADLGVLVFLDTHKSENHPFFPFPILDSIPAIFLQWEMKMNNFQTYAHAGFGRIPHSFSLRRNVRPWWDQTLIPGSDFVNRWNHIFLIAFIIALFLDPLYFFVPIIGGNACMNIDLFLGVWVTLARTVTDLFFIMHVILKFRTAFVNPNSRVFGRGELVMDRRAIAIRYLKSDFVVDIVATLPLPQIVIWFIIPAVKNPTADHANHTLSLMVLIQYIPRFLVMFPLNRRIVKTTGIVATALWSGAAYNLLLYVLASHVLGASWYVTSIQRQNECWRRQCFKERNSTHSPSCVPSFLDCSSKDDPARIAWLKTSHMLVNCDARNNDNFPFGLFAEAFTNHVAEAPFIDKYFYCLWWGLRNLSSYGQNLMTSTFEGETLFSIAICIMGLVLFGHLIGNVQTYMQSASARLEEWRIRRRDTEEWMRHRQLPPELQERVRRFVQYKWIATRGVDEESILKALPLDIRRRIQRHLCLALVRRVLFFAQMDDQLLDAICERLGSSLNTRDTFIVREGDPVSEMLFIIRGLLESSTTNGGRSGFFNSITLRAGDFCGEELLTWALTPASHLNLPLSTRTVKAISEVEAFALRAVDLRFVAKQFKRLHSKKLQHAFRYYSHHWRTWGACFIQAAWRRHIRRKLQMELARQESLYVNQVLDGGGGSGYYYEEEGANAQTSGDNANNVQQLGATILASRFAKNTRQMKAAQKIPRPDDSTLKMPKLFKPEEPDFFDDHE